MAAPKKVLTKSQIVAHFAEKFDLSKKMVSTIIDEVKALAIAETKKTGSFVLPGVGKLVEKLKKGMLNEQVMGGKQASFSGVMGPYLNEMPNPAAA